MKTPKCPAERTQYTHPSIDATISDMFLDEDGSIEELSATVTDLLAMDHQQAKLLLHKKPNKKPVPAAGM